MKIILIVSILCITLCRSVSAQDVHILSLKSGDWKFHPALFYVSSIVDGRNDKSAGKKLSGKRMIPVRFRISAESDLSHLINGSVKQDTTKIPLVLSIDKFLLSETGTIANHKVILEFSFHIYREFKGKKYKMYEGNGNPELSIRGEYAGAHEKIIEETMKNFLKNFNDWVNNNSDQPPLAHSVRVKFDLAKSNTSVRDTIYWGDNYKLKWSDFKGIPDNSPFMAQSNCVFNYNAMPFVRNGIMELNIEMYCCFDKTHSWVKQGKQTDELLSHEQLHFDVCELNVNKLRRKIADYEFNPMEFDSEISKLFNESWEEYQKQQQSYDAETEHGIISKQQQRWEEEIGDQLKSIPAK